MNDFASQLADLKDKTAKRLPELLALLDDPNIRTSVESTGYFLVHGVSTHRQLRKGAAVLAKLSQGGTITPREARQLMSAVSALAAGIYSSAVTLRRHLDRFAEIRTKSME